jgi:BCD family chlorophyll transporter-like MFS transporter
MIAPNLSWFSIVRLGLIQACLGAVVVLTTVTLNRVMVVELSLPAILPGALVGLHYAVQVLRPRMGFGSDIGGRRTPWIIGGMAALAAGGVAASAATVLMGTHTLAGVALAVPAFALVGAGVGAAGTSVLVLMAKQVAPSRRPAAATILWVLMILGIAVTATVAGKLLHPFSLGLLMRVAAEIAGAALVLTCAAVWGVEQAGGSAPAPQAKQAGFLDALREVWAERQARRFAIFVFVSMLAYSAQELILEPFAGAVFALTPGQTAGLTGLQHGGVMAGMVLVALLGSLAGAGKAPVMRALTMGGCAASALCLLALAAAGLVGPAWPLKATVFALGASNGAFAVSAIGAMMGLAGGGRDAAQRGPREGVRMGLWGAAQALAFGLGGLLGTGASDVARILLGSPAVAYGAVFLGQALLFVAAAQLAGGVFQGGAETPPSTAGHPRMTATA